MRPVYDRPTRATRRALRLFAAVGPLGSARAAMRDALAGLTLAAMSVPQALAYARIAGTPVITGLYTLLLPPAAFAAFGSSRYLVVAADSATAAILAGGLAPLAPAASDHYVALASFVALLTASCLVLARLLRLGFLADFLSQTVLVGFLTGVGIQVGIAVLGEMVGLTVRSHRSVAQLMEILGEPSSVHLPTLGVSAAVVVVVLGCRRVAPRFPAALLAVVGAIGASAAVDFPAHGIAVLGPVAGGLPRPRLPRAGWAEIRELIPLAISCFVVIVAQSAATARAFALRHRDALDEDADLVGLSAASLAAAASGTFVVNGSPTQTAMVESAGGRSQLAHLVTAAVVAVVLLVLTGPLRHVPQCVLGAIVFTIGVGLVDLRGLRDIGRESPGELRLAGATAVVVALVGVEQGVLLAMVLSLLRHVRHSYRPHTAVLVADGGQWRPTPPLPGARSGPGLVIYRFGAALFYANATSFAAEVRALVEEATEPVRWLVIEAGAITSVDYTAARTLRALQQDLIADRVALLLVHVGADLRADLDRHRLTGVIGPRRLFASLHEALAAIRDDRVERVS